MKCSKCGIEYSDKVINIHIKMCNVGQITPNDDIVDYDKLTEEELRAEAKKQGIKSWHNKKLENIIKELVGD